MSKELREELEQIVTRNGNSGRIPELLEAELDQLVNLITTRETEARLNELEILSTDKHLGWFINLPQESNTDTAIKFSELLHETFAKRKSELDSLRKG